MMTVRKRHPLSSSYTKALGLLRIIRGLILTVGAVAYMHRYEDGGLIIINGLMNIILLRILWWRDVIREATFGRKTYT